GNSQPDVPNLESTQFQSCIHTLASVIHLSNQVSEALEHTLASVMGDAGSDFDSNQRCFHSFEF
ncbi:hypothetical protein, partial [Vibrio parahaemolyticus]|uniref:hypothetical protein n=1 Tax=Vibrio parahaemolyticus TaxID=670 RepID=UPI001BAFDDD3